MEHFHDHDGVSTWGADMMRTHLRVDHDLTPPMSWETGRLHQAHLEAHQGAAAPATEKKCEAYYGVGDGTAATCQRPAGHPEISEDGIGHSPFPIRIQPKAEEAPMQIHDHDVMPARSPALYRHLREKHGISLGSGDETRDNPVQIHGRAHGVSREMPTPDRPADADDGPRKLYAAANYSGALGWNEVGPKERDLWRVKYAKQQLAGAVNRTTLREQDSEWDARQQEAVDDADEALAEEDVKAQGQHQIMVDRVICAMTGVHFDTWVLDENLNLRGALRGTHGKLAEGVLYNLERGGLMPFGPLTAIEQGALNQLREERRTAQTERDAALGEAGEARRQMAEQQRALQEMAEAQAGSEALVHDLEQISNGLREQLAIDQREHGASLDAVQRRLEESEQRRQGLFQEMGEIRRQLDEAVAERDLLRQDKARLKADLEQMATGNQRNIAAIDALEADLADARDERDRAQQALMAKLTEAAELREERDRIRRDLGGLIAVLRSTGWKGSTVFQRLEKILAGPVSTVTGASQAPAEQPTLIRGDTSGIRHITLEEARAEDEGEDDLSWARRFAEGGDAL